VAIGAQGYPFNLTKTRYEAGLCPVTERMYYQELLCFETCMYDVSLVQAKLLVEAIHKVYRQREALRD
jgi:hypothetical protein